MKVEISYFLSKTLVMIKVGVKSMGNSLRLLFSIQLFIFALIIVGCRGRKESSENASLSQIATTDTNKKDGITIDTTTQEWLDQHYYRGTTTPLPDSLKGKPGLGERFWYKLPSNKYEPIVFDKLQEPNLEEVKVYFMDSLTKSATKSVTLWKENPYNNLPFKKTSGEKFMKIDGIIRYDLKNASRDKLKPILLSMGVNIDTIPTKIIGAEVMTGQDSPMERTALANSYAISIVDENGKMIAAQTTYKIYDRYGTNFNKIVENGHGLYQMAITRDGKHIGAIFGGRYGCRSSQYIKPYFKIFQTNNGELFHEEVMEFSNGISSSYDYFCVVLGGDPRIKYDMNIYNLKTKIISSGKVPLLKTEFWKENGIISQGKEILFSSDYFKKTPFSPIKK